MAIKYEENYERRSSSAGACHLPGWSPRDSPHQWLRTLQDMALNRQ